MDSSGLEAKNKALAKLVYFSGVLSSVNARLSDSSLTVEEIRNDLMPKSERAYHEVLDSLKALHSLGLRSRKDLQMHQHDFDILKKKLVRAEHKVLVGEEKAKKFVEKKLKMEDRRKKILEEKLAKEKRIAERKRKEALRKHKIVR